MPIVDPAKDGRDVIPSALTKDARDTIEMAAALGWSVHVTGANSVTIMAPGDPCPKKYHFNNIRRSIPQKRMRSDILRFADPLKLELARAAAYGEVGRESFDSLPRAAEVAIRQLPKDEPVPTTPTRKQRKQNTRKTAVQAAMERAEAKAQEEASKVSPVPTADEAKQQVAESRRVIKVEPMIAKRTEGIGYESKTTLVRTWSDGSIDYKCTECEFTSTKRKGVSAHYAPLHSTGKGSSTKGQPSMKADTSGAMTYKPRETRVAALVAALRSSFHDGEASIEELARASLMWVHEQTKQRTQHSVEAEEMGPEETLERIRLLIGGSETHTLRSEVEVLRANLSEAQRQLAEQMERAAEATHDAVRARETLRAFTDLAADLAKETGEQ